MNINIIQAYALTADKSNEEIKDFYRQPEGVFRLAKTNEIKIILGDFNAKVGEGRTTEK